VEVKDGAQLAYRRDEEVVALELDFLIAPCAIAALGREVRGEGRGVGEVVVWGRVCSVVKV
jgi:hypothetical protein